MNICEDILSSATHVRTKIIFHAEAIPSVKNLNWNQNCLR